jgi:formylglycine-generating enzyme required for sulfatase activity
MSKKTPKSVRDKSKPKVENTSRALPILFAGFVCLFLAVSTGYGAWYFFGKKSNGSENRSKITNWATNLSEMNKKEEETPLPVVIESEKIQTETFAKIPTPIQTAEPSLEPTPTPQIEESPVQLSENPSGTVLVEGGVVEIGGERSRPVKKEIVEDFFIADTEVTNIQYAEFIKETGKTAPPGWKKYRFPEGLDDFPVVGVSFSDAVEFCKWFSEKTKNEVRLPTEAEWERAARGNTKNKYPWGNKWEKNATSSKETGGKLKRVKSSEINKSEFGAYDMVGSVWEWTTSQITEPNGKIIKKDGASARVIKGGAAKDPQNLITTTSADLQPEFNKDESVGFRYIVLIKKQN